MAIDRAKELFGADHANVQPHCGSSANMGVYFAVLNPGDTASDFYEYLIEDSKPREMMIKAEVIADPEKIRAELERALALKPMPQVQTPHTQAVQPPAPKQQPVSMQAHAAQPQPFMPVVNTTADYSGYLRAAQLTEVYSLLQPLKMTMLEYYMMNGDWPSSLADIRLKPEEMTDGRYLDKVRLGKNGEIMAYLSDTFGKDKKLSLAPRSIMGGMQTRWECSTNVNMKGMITLSNLNCREDPNMQHN